MKTKIVLSLAVGITAALVTQPASADLVTEILLTENSSTSLSATFGNGSTTGITVLNTGVDQWTVTIAFSGSFDNIPLGGIGWIEPENSSKGNIITSPSQNNQLFIVSDALGHPGDVLDGALVLVGHFPPVSINGVTLPPAPIEVSFHDAATSENAVPDTGSTFGLLALALAALVGASRLRSIRAA